ncbi:aminotransferase class I/II-fold pyridoxal phosphate-dependent enzyme [Falsochrobactrum sp. TDYN1]|uniref:Aminotransferase class I/II-fold pyridoxal phosphate-dependent enzyme n=1 Tax=Falsochrobactrum tianjinense TaxID=2706015 RepID=A0A949UUH2_9HYPH|nr:aminotransferase class I/II-fold pyridoxal phosphate-dependent enzyme [Falsochrobactrum sp. TDYN1]MBV2143787.1 aminotransferase class I/II-fold pyridoxal phosphate-dependent enzyme [Falsochrobactrum sp. TDYN1]
MHVSGVNIHSDEQCSAKWLAEQLTTRTKRGITVETSTLIRSGVLEIGVRLPAIRDLAYILGVSPTTVADAWRELRKQKLITGLGRNGSWVSGDYIATQPKRLIGIDVVDKSSLNLSKAVPDPLLFPPLKQALIYASSTEGLNSYDRINIIPELKSVIQQTWPYDAEAFIATNGGYDAIYSILQAFITPGSYIAIEDPTSVRFIDMFETLNVQPLPVSCDLMGPLPDALSEAIKLKPAIFLFQPRLHAITGQTIPPGRLKELAGVLENSHTLIIEDDGMNDISSSPSMSLGQYLPDRVMHIRSFSKTMGPDLRTAVLSGTAKMIEQIHSSRSFGSGWTSRLLQSATAWLLKQPDTANYIENARNIYEARRNKLSDYMADYGVHLPQGNGLCLWIPVQCDVTATKVLASNGITVQPGSKFSVQNKKHIRVATSNIKSNYQYIAKHLNHALNSSPD